MKTLIISTHKYKHVLDSFATNKGINIIARHTYRRENGIYTVKCTFVHNEASISNLMSLLTDIAQLENPIYKHSPKLRDMAKDLHKTPMYAATCKALSRFLRHSRTLHLEGYVTFRMADYRDKLDIMSYSLIKKMKLIHKD